MLCHSIYLQVVKVHLFNLGLPMNRYTFVLPSENQNAFACSPSAQMPFIMLSRRSVFFCKDIHETLKYVDEFTELKNDEIQKEHTPLSLSLSLSLLVDLSMHFDFPERMCSPFLSLFTFAKTVWIQIRPEWNSSFVNLKICACDRKYAKSRTKADAHHKMGFQYISISVYIVRSHARIQRGDRGSGPPPPLKNHKNIEFLSNTGPDPL